MWKVLWTLLSLCHWADPSKDLKWSNVPGVKLSSLSESDDTLPSLQALSDLHYLFGGFMDYLWSRELDISNFGPANRKILPVSRDDMPYSCLIGYPKHSALTARISGCEMTVTIRDDGYQHSMS
ncbi:hypothetical protein Tco_0976510 [Tanacetum coccineum]|uniref:Uncharacterized protein n=1 Tax=Tanacetum coccineum TaxID=301880 RepID=A0ABQ5EHJ1_9ASTR